MRTGLTLQQSEILDANVKKCYWLFEVDLDNDGTIDYYWSTQDKTWDGHDYGFKVLSFTPLTLTMGNPELGIIPPNKIAIKAGLINSAADGDEISPNNNAISDNQIEANATTGCSAYNAPDIFESTDSGAPYLGNYHFHVVSNQVGLKGFSVDGLSLSVGTTYHLRVWYKVLTGTLWILENDGVDSYSIQPDLISSSYSLLDITFTAKSNATKLLFITQNDVGEFYVDALSLRPTGIKYASDFEDASITIRLVVSADLREVLAPADDTILDTDSFKIIDVQEAELMAWRFRVTSARAVDQVLTLNCQDWFSLHLEGDYPNTPLISDLFPADIMKADNICVPIPFGQPFFPLRWLVKNTDATYVDADTFTVAGDQTALFSAGQFLLADCGADGLKACWALSSAYTTLTTVNLTAGSDALTSNLATVATDHYLLGPSGKTYTVDRARTPREVNFKSTYLAADYTIKQDTVEGSDSNSYKVAQLLCHDADKDGTNDANGFWGVSGKEIYDAPFRFSRSDLVSTTNPADIAQWIFEDWGIPTSEIDSASQAAAAAVFTSRSFSLNIGLWYQMPRERLISKLFTVAGMIPVIRDTIGFKVLTKASQLTITEDLVKPESFQIIPTFTQKKKDSGYITWQSATEPVDQVNKSLVAAKGSTDNYSNTTIEAEWVNGSAEAQKAGKLALQRILLKDKTISFTAQSKILALEPGDMITISPQNFGAEGSSYDCLITRMTIGEGLSVKVECVKFSDDLDDWEDLSASALTVEDADTSRSYSPVYQGPRDSVNQAGDRANEITQTILIGADGELKTNDDPATNGGFIATNSELVCYNSSGDERFKAIYSGADQGDVVIGDYAGGKGMKWDQSADKLTVKVDSSGGVSVAGGGDITLTGSDTDPGIIKFDGTSYAVEMGGNAGGNLFLIRPGIADNITCYIGRNGAWWGESDARFKYLRCYANRQCLMSSGDWSGAVNGASLEVIGDISESEPTVTMALYDKTAQDVHYYYFKYGYCGPENHKTQDLGRSSVAWDDVYADDYYNVADFFFLDQRQEAGQAIPIDDLSTIKGIKPSGKFDPRTGLELIDDNTLPEWLVSRDKKTGKIMRDPDGRPYLSLKTMISLLMGAIRQLDAKKKDKK